MSRNFYPAAAGTTKGFYRGLSLSSHMEFKYANCITAEVFSLCPMLPPLALCSFPYAIIPTIPLLLTPRM